MREQAAQAVRVLAVLCILEKAGLAAGMAALGRVFEEAQAVATAAAEDTILGQRLAAEAV